MTVKHIHTHDPGGLGNPHGLTVCPDQYYSIHTRVLAALEAAAAIQTIHGWTRGGRVYKLNPIKKQWLSGANIDPVFLTKSVFFFFFLTPLLIDITQRKDVVTMTTAHATSELLMIRLNQLLIKT